MATRIAENQHSWCSASKLDRILQKLASLLLTVEIATYRLCTAARLLWEEMPYVLRTLDAMELAQLRNRKAFFGLLSYVATSIVQSQMVSLPERPQTRDAVANLGRWFRDWQSTHADAPPGVTAANCFGQWSCLHLVPSHQHRVFLHVCLQQQRHLFPHARPSARGQRCVL